METHLKLKALFEEYQAEQDNFEIKGVKHLRQEQEKLLWKLPNLLKQEEARSKTRKIVCNYG